MEEIANIDDLVAKLSSVQLPQEEFCPSEITEWLDIFSPSYGTRKELTFGLLPTVGAFLGRSELKLFLTHKERANMYCIALAPSGGRQNTSRPT